MPGPYALTTHDGKTVDRITKAALIKAEWILGYSLSITQGSYSTSVRQSAGTHARGGVVDLEPFDHVAKVRALRAVGFAAWFRPAIPGEWGDHIHAVLIGHERLAPVAARQVEAYLAGRDGLASNGADPGPRQYVDRRFEWVTLLEQARRLLRRVARRHPTKRPAVTAALAALKPLA